MEEKLFFSIKNTAQEKKDDSQLVRENTIINYITPGDQRPSHSAWNQELGDLGSHPSKIPST